MQPTAHLKSLAPKVMQRLFDFVLNKNENLINLQACPRMVSRSNSQLQCRPNWEERHCVIAVKSASTSMKDETTCQEPGTSSASNAVSNKSQIIPI